MSELTASIVNKANSLQAVKNHSVQAIFCVSDKGGELFDIAYESEETCFL